MNTPPPLTDHQSSGPAGPLPENERLAFLDVARGGAIFGIFLVNIIGFKSPSIVSAMIDEPWLPGAFNQLVLFSINFLAATKFVAIFTFLFGMGAAMQFRRSLETGQPFKGFFAKRMALLALLGLTHGWLLWMGDILFIYALFGFAGLLFFRLTPKALVVCSVGFWVVPLAGRFFMWLPYSGTNVDDWHDVEGWRQYGEWLVAAYGSGTLAEIQQARFWEWLLFWRITIWVEFPQLFGIFLLGVAVGKTGLQENLPRWRPLARKLIRVTLPLGLLLSLLGTLAWHYADVADMRLLIFVVVLFPVGGLLLSFSYLLMFEALASSVRWDRAARALAWVGRMSLSNYLLQSLVANFIFLSVGLGIYGQVTAQAGVAIVAAVFLGQVFLSRWWLRHHAHGPIEWVWRTQCHGMTVPWRRVDRGSSE